MIDITNMTSRLISYCDNTIKDTKGLINFSAHYKTHSIPKRIDVTQKGHLSLINSKQYIELVNKKYVNHFDPFLITNNDFWEDKGKNYYYETPDNKDYWWKSYGTFNPTIEQWNNSLLSDYIIMSGNDHRFRGFDGKIITSKLHCDYMNGFHEKGEDYEEKINIELLYDILSKNCWVTDLELKEVPYYNCRFYGQRQVEFNLYIPESEEVAQFIYEKEKDFPRPWFHKSDPLGISKAIES